MRALLIITSFLFISLIKLHSQEFLPFASSNYAGITGVRLHPASIADSRYRFDMAISATDISFYNTFYGIDPYLLSHPKLLKDIDFKDPAYFSRNLDGKDKTAIVSQKQDFMSFMLTLSDKDAIAFTPSVRSIVNVDNMTETLAVLIDELDKEPELWDILLKNANLNAQLNSWVEYGFTYARIVADKEKHFFKAGATLKINQGLGSAYIFMKDLNYEVNDTSTVSIYNTYTNYGTSDNLNEDFTYHFDANPSLSLDLGFVYEYRPKWMKYKYEMDGNTSIWRRDQDKYLVRLGFTVSDLGSVRYRRNPDSRDFTADIHNLVLGDLGIESIDDFNKFIADSFLLENPSDKFNQKLPVSMSFQADVRIAEGFYINFTPFIALNQGNNQVNKVHYISTYNLVPRYDEKWFGVSLPVQYNSFKQWNVGLGFRVGALWFGSNDILSILATSKNRYGTSVSMAFKVPIFYGTSKDRDNDKISDKKDRCPDVAGLFETNGCPDKDHDGVMDQDDNCPDDAGPAELYGCPDRDGDGVLDKDDLCPDTKGLSYLNGCPDSDGDSIIDQNDACPYNAGSVKMSGCPDQDGDGIADKDDNCPTVAGTVENRGCPFIDTDGDGIKDELDNCPGLKGAIDNFGCPYQDTDNDSIPDKDDDCPSIPGTAIFRGCPDTDSDGISDKYDLCPTLAGIAQNNGCPEIKKEEQEVLNRAFSNLEFETGKSVIRKSSLNSLDELAGVLQKRSEFKLQLSGHTDNVGKPESNLELSKNRTLAVKNYLVKKGIQADRIKAEWYGQTKPVAPNTTPEGRQQNRRVEMNIVFD